MVNQAQVSVYGPGLNFTDDCVSSGMMKSGMTIVQIYSSYVEATEQLALEKDKNRLQTQYLDQILKEIEEKAPLLQQQRADYENALLNQVGS